MEGIGQQILNQKLKEEENLAMSSSAPEIFEEESSSKSNLYLETTLLSQFLEENQLDMDHIANVTEEMKRQIASRVSTIIEQLNLIGKQPSKDIQAEPGIIHVYRVLSYALILLQKCGASAKLQQKYAILEKEKDSLQKKYDSLLQSANSADTLSNRSTSMDYLQKITHDSDTFSLQGENKQLALELEQARRCLKKSDKLVSYLISRFSLPPTTNISNILSQINKAEGHEDLNNENSTYSDSSEEMAQLSQNLEMTNLFNKEIEELTQ